MGESTFITVDDATALSAVRFYFLNKGLLFLDICLWVSEGLFLKLIPNLLKAKYIPDLLTDNLWALSYI